MKDKKKYDILIVDDDKFLLDMYAVKFAESDFNVYTALSSQDALDTLKNQQEKSQIDVVLLDIVMPGMDGFELLGKIKKVNFNKNIFVIMLSNLGQESDVKKAIDAGSDGYIIKANSTPTEVVEKVLAILSGKKSTVSREKSKSVDDNK